MYGTAAWIALAAASLSIEWIARRRPSRVATLERTGARIAVSVTGRVLLWALWIFVGVHLFSRYTIPR